MIMTARLFQRLVAACVGLVLGGGALAAPPSELLRALGVPPTVGQSAEARAIQYDLAWIGLYNGGITNTQDSGTVAATRSFQASLNASRTGQLSQTQRRTLAERARAAKEGYGFTRVKIDWLGIAADLPEGVMVRPKLSGKDLNSMTYGTHHGGQLRLRFDALTDVNVAPSRFLTFLRDDVTEGDNPPKITGSGSLSSTLFLISESASRRQVIVGQKKGSEWRLLTISHSVDTSDALRPAIHQILRSLDFFAGPLLSQRERNRQLAAGQSPGAKGLPTWYLTMIGNGSGSVVSRQGHILTNHHVITGCDWITVNGKPSSIVASDVRLDLALLMAPSAADRNPVRFRRGNPRLGEAVSVMGYPLFRSSQSLNYTRGYVSSVVGFGGNRNYVQVTAPVQPGNSGGPVLDASGRQVAVVVAKTASWFQIEQNVENISWVIRGDQALEFLQRNGVKPIVEDRPPTMDTPNVRDVAQWRQITVRIECHRS